MSLNEYNLAVQAILAEQQAIAQETATLCMSGSAHVLNPAFVGLLSRQATLIQEVAKLNAEAMLGIGASRV